MTRRHFLLSASGALAAAACPAAPAGAGTASSGAFRTCLRKAVIRKRLTPEIADEIRAAGFDGVELRDPAVTCAEARVARELAIARGLTIHSFMGAWFRFNEPAHYAAEVARAKDAIRLTAAYGASVMLIVPSGGWRGDLALPPWRDIKPVFDPATLEMTAAVAGDNAPYAAYIAYQNAATQSACRAMAELIPVAAAEGVILAIENVGNRLWLSPDFAAAFVRHFRSPWVKAYFDLGNQYNISPADAWLRALGPEIVKLHIKDEVFAPESPYGIREVPLGTGMLDFKTIRRTIDEIGYHGWVTVESKGWPDDQHAVLLDRFFAGML